MARKQLSIFKQKLLGKALPRQTVAPVTPIGESSIMQTLPSFQAYLSETYAEKTVKMYFGDCRELSIYFKEKKLKQITLLDLQQWIGSLVAKNGRDLDRKTVNRKVSAVITYFLWLQSTGAITEDLTTQVTNTR